MYLYLSDHGITCSSPLQFDDKQLLLVLADGEQIDWTRIRWELLPARLFRFVEVMRSCKRSAGPVGDQEVLKVLLQSKDRGVFNGWVLTDECLSLRLSLDQLLQFLPVFGDVADCTD